MRYTPRLTVRSGVRASPPASISTAIVAVEVQRLHGHQIDDPFKPVAGAQRQLHQEGLVAQFFLQIANDAKGIRPGTVHLVDKRQPGHVIAIHLPINGDRLTLHAAPS